MAEVSKYSSVAVKAAKLGEGQVEQFENSPDKPAVEPFEELAEYFNSILADKPLEQRAHKFVGLRLRSLG